MSEWFSSTTLTRGRQQLIRPRWPCSGRTTSRRSRTQRANSRSVPSGRAPSACSWVSATLSWGAYIPRASGRKELFVHDADKITIVAEQVAANGDGGWAGVVFRGEAPCVVDGDVEMIRGAWTVLGWDDSAKRYDIGLAAEDGGYTTRVGTAYLERLLRDAETATRRPGPAVNAVCFDATDYPLAVAMVCAHLGDITSMDVTKMSTVLATRAGGRAGAVLPPTVLAAGASESALRRHARA
eukprot:1051112-Prymnesium_polylepis.1